MKYRDMTSEQKEMKKACVRKWQDENREKYREYQKKYQKELRNENREKYYEPRRKYQAIDVNSTGITKKHIRIRSRHILFKNHTKLPEYEIHHCFGYDDPNKFIYIPKTLHLQIHQLLRDKNIPADSDHWNIIRDIVNSCEAYTYIRA